MPDIQEQPKPQEVVAPDGLADLVAQRDKHLAQFMEINAKGAFAVITAILAVTFGVDRVKGLLHEHPYFCEIAWAVGIAVVLLAYAAFRLSWFHTGRIRKIQKRILAGDAKARRGDYQIIPDWPDANFAVFIGILLLLAAALGALFLSMSTKL